MKKELRASVLLVAAFLMVLAVGCVTNPGEAASASDEDVQEYVDSDKIRVGDMLNITFTGTSSFLVQDHNERVSEDGFITLQQIGEVKAVGKGRVELQKEIKRLYVPKYYKNLTVTIAPDERFFYVYGEVNKPDRHFYAGELTVLGAISAAGDFTDFANHKKVKLIRTDGTVEIINCKEALNDPRKNVEVLPGDTINVPRRII